MGLCSICVYIFDFKHVDVNPLNILFRYAFDESNLDSIFKFIVDLSICGFFDSKVAIFFRVGSFYLFNILAYDSNRRYSLNPL